MRNFGSRVAGTPIRAKISTPLKADQFRTKNTLTA